MNRSASYIYVLTALRGGPLHGLGMTEAVSDFTDGTVLLGPGTLYRCIKDLVEDGYIRRAAPPPGEAGGGRKYYALTEAGRAELSEAMRELEMLLAAARRSGHDGHPAGATS